MVDVVDMWLSSLPVCGRDDVDVAAVAGLSLKSSFALTIDSAPLLMPGSSASCGNGGDCGGG